MNQPIEPSILAGLDESVRELFKDTMGSHKMLNRYVLSQYLPSNTAGENKVLLTGALFGFKGIIQSQLVDLLEAYEEEVSIQDAGHPGARVYPTLKEHMTQLTHFYADVVDELFEGLKQDVARGLRSAPANRKFSELSQTWTYRAKEWTAWPALTAAWGEELLGVLVRQ